MGENTIKCREVLLEMDNTETLEHKINTFSIQFYKQNGELVSLIQYNLILCVTCV